MSASHGASLGQHCEAAVRKCGEDGQHHANGDGHAPARRYKRLPIAMCHLQDGPGQSQRTTPSSHRLRDSLLPSAVATFPITANTSSASSSTHRPLLQDSTKPPNVAVTRSNRVSNLHSWSPLHLPSQVNNF